MSHKLFRPFISLFLVLIIAFAASASALAAAGALDPTFGTGGKVITDFGYGEDAASAVAIQADGKIVVGGGNGVDFVLARYNSDGSLDEAFDTDGKVITDLGGASIISAIAIQPDGRIVAAGTVSGDFALARYNSDGSLDAAFDADGIVITDFGGGERGSAIAIQPDGRIVVAGSHSIYTDDFAVVRYNSDGSLDTSFDGDGMASTSIGTSQDVGTAVALQADGRIVVAGYTREEFTNNQFALARYNSDGSLDTTFDSDGIRITELWGGGFAHAIAIQPDGRIVVAGDTFNLQTGQNFTLMRHNGDGSLDPTFGIGGILITEGEAVYALALQPDGKIIAAGISSSAYDSTLTDFALARYDSSGTLDPTFGTDGKMTTDFNNTYDMGYAVALQPDGRIVVAGQSYHDGYDQDFALARYDVETSTIEVTLDIKPGRPQNRISLKKNMCRDDDNLYAAILTTPTFDAQTVDASSLKLGDPLLSGTASPLRGRIRDVDLDGDKDMALAFNLCAIVTDGALDENTAELALTGRTLDGVSIMGRDSVMVIREDD